MNIIKQHISSILQAAGVTGTVELSTPPKTEMGDLAFGCFALAKEQGKNPADVASELAVKINEKNSDLLQAVKAFGPYVNFFLNGSAVASLLKNYIGESFGTHDLGKGKNCVIEFACPNPLKAFHLGHLKNLITGEAVVRMFENAGYNVTRTNYQGDVGMHVAKALWGIFDKIDEFKSLENKTLTERVEFLGQAYAHGAQHFESSEEGKQAVIAYNDKVYERNPDIQDVYQQSRAWSLEYFEEIYKQMNSKFDCYYFESETYERGIELVKEQTEKGVFEVGDGGAIIYPGEKLGLHNRVFINSKGFPTYEAKEIALAEKHFQDHQPHKIIHVVGKEQTEYFKVVFTAIEEIFPKMKGIEYHLPGGFLQLKGEQKMSSRKGNIITGDQLIDTVRELVYKIMQQQDGFVANDTTNDRLNKITAAALKYAMLKADVKKDVAFDMEESISTSGDSGPYLLYIVARIKSIINKAGNVNFSNEIPSSIDDEEKKLLVMLCEYPEVTLLAVQNYDPSVISKYLFTLAQQFNSFYAACPVLKADADIKQFRLWLIAQVAFVMSRGLIILGIETVDEM